jgi:hypothetical protein
LDCSAADDDDDDPGICLEKMRKTKKTTVRIAGLQAEI